MCRRCGGAYFPEAGMTYTPNWGVEVQMGRPTQARLQLRAHASQVHVPVGVTPEGVWKLAIGCAYALPGLSRTRNSRLATRGAPAEAGYFPLMYRWSKSIHIVFVTVPPPPPQTLA
jgi:hypothetical protein